MQRNKKVWLMHQEKNKSLEIVPEEAQGLNLLDNDITSAVLNMFEEWK